jgi:hypothetical protein
MSVARSIGAVAICEGRGTITGQEQSVNNLHHSILKMEKGKLYICVSLFALFLIGCGESKHISPAKEKIQHERTEKASQALSEAVKLAEHDDPAGFLKLYEISTDDITYTVEYSEVAYDQLSILLYTHTSAWVKTFSKVDQVRFKKKFIDVNDGQLPDGITTSEQFLEGIKLNLVKIKGDKQEMELVAYLLGMIEPFISTLRKTSEAAK